jgi:pyruvate dehydrogenase E1 component beta subunit
VASVARTGRLVIVEENQYTGGWGTMVAAEIASRLHGELRAPITRVTAPDTPVPFSEALERRYLPNPEYLRSQIDKLVDTGHRPTPWWEEEGLT